MCVRLWRNFPFYFYHQHNTSLLFYNKTVTNIHRASFSDTKKENQMIFPLHSMQSIYSSIWWINENEDKKIGDRDAETFGDEEGSKEEFLWIIFRFSRFFFFATVAFHTRGGFVCHIVGRGDKLLVFVNIFLNHSRLGMKN